ncbi:helix-turn-helix domain-containing protein [Bacillus cereus]|uniref:HTH domain-containing protein n=1 Tax=Bacillus cereus TaxID=1396 RepID=A0A9X7B5T1_BACCE|nr:helix-turn-helix domain-containing protein [Bacillus cereus]PED41066.1 hypothetical protein CON26_26985 [Bacillus cereus]PFV00971.1 hypothetical protein COK98_30475 [Bacillus cereus]
MLHFNYNLITEKSVKRKIFILETLNNSQKLISSKYLANQLNCSTRTIASDISQLKNEIPSNWEIIGIKTKGYILIKPLTDPIFPIIKINLIESPIYQLMLGFFNNKHYSLEKWSQRLYINKLTLATHLKNFRKTLDTNKLTIKPPNIQWQGEELHIRHFYIAFFYNTLKYTNEVFLSIELRSKLASIIKQHQFSIEFENLCVIIFVTINRISYKHYLTKKINYVPIFNKAQSKCFNDIINTIEDYYKIKFSKAERNNLNIAFFLAIQSDEQGSSILELLSKYNKKEYENYLTLIDMLAKENKIYKEKELLRIKLASHFYKMLFWNQNQLPISYYFTENINSQNISSKQYNKNKRILNEWNFTCNHKFNLKELAFMAFNSTLTLRSYKKKINILFLFSGNRIEANLIYSILKDSLGNEVNIHRDLNKSIKYEFIIANYQLLDEVRPVIYIPEKLSMHEISSIKSTIFPE